MAVEQPLVYFEKSPGIYPRSIKGRFRNVKYGILALAYAVFFLLPYARWDRGYGLPNQALLFDLPQRVFYVFGLTVWPQQIIWLALFLIFAAVFLFFITGLAGRVFCGYFCFQTLWTDLFFVVERWVEGDRNARMRLDKAPWGPKKVALKVVKHALWLAVAFATGFSFSAYFVDAFQLMREFFLLQAPTPAYVTTFILMASTYTMAGFMREQVCVNICPYGRFQSVMFDENTQIVAYDRRRGEGAKGRVKPGREIPLPVRQEQGYGDCIDCGLCVQVCPTGIDIRNGLQYQCISCALCIDACDSVMDSVKLPRGLIRYTSENALQEKPVKHWTPRSWGYVTALSLILVIFFYSVSKQARILLDVQQERQPLYVQLSDGRIQNKYYIKVTNRSSKPATYTVKLADLPQAELKTDYSHLRLRPGKADMITAYVKLDPRYVRREKEPFAFQVIANGRQPEASYKTEFYVPRSDIGS